MEHSFDVTIGAIVKSTGEKPPTTEEIEGALRCALLGHKIQAGAGEIRTVTIGARVTARNHAHHQMPDDQVETVTG